MLLTLFLKKMPFKRRRDEITARKWQTDKEEIKEQQTPQTRHNNNAKKNNKSKKICKTKEWF